MTAMPPKNKKELQRFLGQLNYLRRFISNLAGKTREFSLLLKLKDSEEFKWEKGHQEAFDKIKEYLSKPPVLMPPRRGHLLFESILYRGGDRSCQVHAHMPILTGRIGKWSLALAEFTLIYYPQRSMKGQAVADFLADHPIVEVAGNAPVDIPVTEKASPVGVVITSPTRIKTVLSFNLDFSGTNNQAEYEALVIGLEILQDLGAKDVLIIGDSQLVLKQIYGEYKCSSLALAPYFTAASQLLDDFEDVTFHHVPRQDNWAADELAQIASGLRMSPELTHKFLLVQRRNHSSIHQRGIQVHTLDIDVYLAGDWRDEIKEALRNLEQKLHYGLKMRILHYVLMENELYRKGDDGLLLRCLGFPEAMKVM
ncbi:uncharacterized protein [Primulina huaijiensis]|uniref:uncharacterized protein n=1 Tax=Primulina huaijiensis TaxID=1492673 RepID=UPI003CC77A5D